MHCTPYNYGIFCTLKEGDWIKKGSQKQKNYWDNEIWENCARFKRQKGWCSYVTVCKDHVVLL